ncbi:hypothetical protein NL676_009051 [Syzygium grande]|nr:hypothetical protein NL676_009051 [Syzygium grande]
MLPEAQCACAGAEWRPRLRGPLLRIPNPFIIIDLRNMRSVKVNVEKGSAWVESGATIGELYYAISQKSKVLGFPASSCPTVGVGGHVSGAGLA